MPQLESDFSLRKMKIAGAVLLGSMFASSMLPLTLVYMPITGEFGWATVAGLALPAMIYLVLGPYRYAKEIGAMPQTTADDRPERPIGFARRSET